MRFAFALTDRRYGVFWQVLQDTGQFMKTVLFLCTGNYYRSRFAEIYFNWLAVRHAVPWQAVSRGLALDPANPGAMSQHTLRWLARREILADTTQRMPLDLTEADLHAAQHIVAVKETEHRPLMIERFPAWIDRVEFWHVDDLDCAAPEHALPELEQHVAELLTRLKTSSSWQVTQRSAPTGR